MALSLSGIITLLPALQSVYAVEQSSIYTDYIETEEQGDISIDVIVDNEEKRIVQSTFKDGTKSIAIFNKLTNTITVKENGKEVVIDLPNDDNINQENNLQSSKASYIEEKTFSNYEYKIYVASDKWILRRPKPGGNTFQINSKSVYKKKSNASALMNFKKAVDNINELE